MYCNQGFKNLICSDAINNIYLYYFLKSKSAYLNSLGRGATFKEISKRIVENIVVPLPDISSQVEIGDQLIAVERIEKQRKRQLSLYDELVKSRFVELFGDPLYNPKEWPKKKLVDICTKLTDGTHFSPKSFQTGEYKYITAKNITKDGFDFSSITYVPKNVHEKIYSRCNPEYGDVLYIKDGVTTGIAICNTLHEEFTLLSSVALLKQNRDILNGYFLCGVLNNKSMYDNIRQNMGGAAITRLTIQKLNNIRIIVPPLELQNQFADFIQQLDKSKLAVQKSLDELEILKKSLMQQYFG